MGLERITTFARSIRKSFTVLKQRPEKIKADDNYRPRVLEAPAQSLSLEQWNALFPAPKTIAWQERHAG